MRWPMLFSPWNRCRRLALVKPAPAVTHMDFASSIGVLFFGAATGVPGTFYGLPA